MNKKQNSLSATWLRPCQPTYISKKPIKLQRNNVEQTIVTEAFLGNCTDLLEV